MGRIFTYILICCLIMVSHAIRAQVNISSTPQEEVSVGVENGAYQLSIENLSGSNATNLSIQIDLPDGILYVPGSLSETSAFSVTEENITDLNNPIFSAPSLSNEATCQFEIAYQGSCVAVDYQLEGNVFRNVVTVQSSVGTFNHTSAAYNILYPSLSIIGISPKNKTLANQDSFGRNITIVNGGNGGISEFHISDQHPEKIVITAVDKGELSDGSLIHLTGADFTSIGNQDTIFDSNESIVIQQTVYGETCLDETYTSTIDAYWAMAGTTCQSSSTYGNVYVDHTSPVLQQVATSSFGTCYSSEASQQILELKNTTVASALNVAIDIYNSSGDGYDPDIYTKIDVSSIQYKIGNSGQLTSISPTSTEGTSSGGNYSCLGGSAVGKVSLNIPDVPGNESIFIYWETQHCCINSCINAQLGGWGSTVAYTDDCDQHYSDDIIGQEPVSANMSFFTETPAYISNGQKKTFTFLVSSHENTYPTADGAYYEVHFSLPAGFVFENLEGDLEWTSSPENWEPTSVNYDAVTGDLIAIYPMPYAFDLNKTELNLMLKADCSKPGATAGSNNISMSVFFVADPSCNDVCKVSMSCDETVSSILNCPESCTEGLAFQNFTIERTSFGAPDNNTDGLPDTSGSLDMSKVKSNRVMTNDTIKSVFYGEVKTSVANPSWEYGYAKSTIPLGAYLTPISADIKIYDASEALNLTASNIAINKSTSGEQGIFDMDFSIATLIANGNSNLTGFEWENEDLIELTVYYTLSTNIGGKIEEVTVNNEFYVSDIANPSNASNKYQCGVFDENITFIGYYFTVNKGSYSSITSCSDYITQLFYLSIGDCCSNYNGGNLFPYEYRNWAWINEAEVTIPAGYEVLDIKLVQWRTKSTNTSIKEVVNNISPDTENGNDLYFNLAQYYSFNGGTLQPSDDGFSGRLSIEIAPTCDVTAGVYMDMPWAFKFQRADRLEEGAVTDWINNTPDKVQFAPASLRLTPLNPKEDGLGKTVTWTVNVENTASNAGARNAWIHAKSQTGSIQVIEVTDANGDVVMPLVGDVYQLGEINAGNTRTFNITATYAACNMEGIDLYAGYECSGYPEFFADFTCPYSQTSLTVEPKPAQFQVRIKDVFVGDECSNNLEVEVEVRSVQLAIVDSIKINVTRPSSNSIDYTSNTSELQYNLSTAYRAVDDPAFSNNTYTYEVVSMDNGIAEEGLPGVLDLNNNTLKLKFNYELGNNFKAGDYLLVNVEGQAACGLKLPDINLAVDPSIKFEKDQNSGLSTGVTNSWSASWGDYDNDGYEDLFVPEYDASKASYLYHNNGDGTFTAVNTAISSDKYSATAATWGDYDNDGDLDLYVATNVGGPGLLYKNLGGGAFEKVTVGSIATDHGYDHSASWVDYDNDGYLDLFVLDIIQTNFNKLYHNNGDGTFTKVEGAAIATAISSSIGATWADYDNDGDMDVFIPNRDRANFLFNNDGNGNFSKVEQGIIVSESLGSVGSSWGDYDNDGDMDLYVANASSSYNALYNNQGDGTFVKVTTGPIVNDKGNTHGSAWTDFDNDGDLDLYVTNDGGEGNYLYINNGDGTFEKLENDVTELDQKSFGVAVADYDNDGDQDIFVANRSNEPNQLYINSRGRCNESICFTLIGTRSNKNGIGAKVRVKANIYGNTVWQMREISAQTGGGVGSQNSMKAFFGLGDATQIDEVVVEWPSGVVQKLTGLSNGTCHEIIEEAGSMVCGVVYYDDNGNCIKDLEEVGIPHQKISIVSADKTYELQTDGNGNYQLYLGTGSYQVNYIAENNWSTCNNSGYSFTVTGAEEDHCGKNFGAATTCTDPDLRITGGTTVLHKGFENTYIVNYENMGVASADNVDIDIVFPDDVEVLSSETPWAGVSGNTYTWNIPSLGAFKRGTLAIETKTELSATIGDMLSTNFSIQAFNGECNAANSTFTDVSEVMGAVDPNDLWVSDKKINRLDRALTYLIRFQNVGNYPATFVKVTDEISPLLDLSSFELISSSHEISELITDGKTITWRFNDINLPDSTSNEKESHGFIKFKINPASDLIHADTIFNQVNIIFDYEAPILTNKVHTVYNNPKKRIINVYPNPFVSQHHTHLRFVGDMAYPYDLTMYNSLGVKILEAKGLEEYTISTSRMNLEAGVYVYQLHDVYGNVMTTGRLVVY